MSLRICEWKDENKIVAYLLTHDPKNALLQVVPFNEELQQTHNGLLYHKKTNSFVSLATDIDMVNFNFARFIPLEMQRNVEVEVDGIFMRENALSSQAMSDLRAQGAAGSPFDVPLECVE